MRTAWASDALHLGESCSWDPQARELTWVDIPTGRVLGGTLDDNLSLTQFERFTLEPPVSWAHRLSSQRWLVAQATSILQLDTAYGRKAVQVLYGPLAPSDRFRLNDGGMSPDGDLLIGTMSHDHTPTGFLYRLSRNVIEVVLDRVAISNGLGWSPDQSEMYYVDSLRGTVEVFRVNLGRIDVASRRVLYVVPPALGVADGLTVARDGTLWVAIWGGGCLINLSPDGQELARALVPTPCVTSCAIADVAGRDVLVATTAREPLSESDETDSAAGRLHTMWL